MGLEISGEGVEELVKEHRAELSTEELQELQKEHWQILAEQISLGEEEGREEVSTALMKEIHGKCVKVQNVVEKYLPDKSVASWDVDLFNEQTISLFRNILEHKNKFLLIGLQRNSLNPSLQQCSVKSRDRTKETPEKLPEIILEEDSSVNN